ncbi:hypothetical protein NEUTE2DRAFT_128986 [Neurospora tetrasperma FGSC 2509]|nr:hypothetical protein NEUTE2DRAFT_128986 [Neurospora tetrasperma FGSC 2509]
MNEFILKSLPYSDADHYQPPDSDESQLQQRSNVIIDYLEAGRSKCTSLLTLCPSTTLGTVTLSLRLIVRCPVENQEAKEGPALNSQSVSRVANRLVEAFLSFPRPTSRREVRRSSSSSSSSSQARSTCTKQSAEREKEDSGQPRFVMVSWCSERPESVAAAEW